MSTKLKLVLFLVPALAAVLFLFWWRSPTQVLTRKVEALVKLTEVGALRLETKDRVPSQLELLVAPQLRVSAPFPIPSGTFTHAELADSLETLHSRVTSCRIIHEELDIQFLTSTEAAVRTTFDVRASWGTSTGITRQYRSEMHFTKPDSRWVLAQFGLKNR